MTEESKTTKKFSQDQIKELLDNYMEPCLVIRNKSDFGKVIQLPDGQTILGRDIEGVLDIGEGKDGISRKHARITVDGLKVTIEDLDSNNGIFIGNEKIRRHILKDGETLIMGKVILQFQYLEPSEIDAYRSFSIDPLTGAYNKKHYISRIGSIFDDMEHAGFIIVDIDNLKIINDRFGHTAGDYTLATFGAVVRNLLKGRDAMFFRYGGDEFIILLKGADLSATNRFGGELISRIDKHNFKSEDAELPVSISIGTSSTTELETASRSLSELLKRADLRLYEEKGNKS